MPPVVDVLDALDAELSRLSTIEAKLDAISRWAADHTHQGVPSVLLSSQGTASGDTRALHVDPDAPDHMSEILSKHGIDRDVYFQHVSRGGMDSGMHALDVLPCAAVDAGKGQKCPKDGTMACGNCKIVKYCSKECQGKHWKTHKSDCKHSVRSTDWKPAWIREGRQPAFLAGPDEPESKDWRQKMDSIAFGAALWGNLPAIDILNKQRDVNVVRTQDLTLAYVASGDIRNVLLTVNALPLDYSGQLTIVLNDITPPVTLRNLLLLSILAQGHDIKQAADVALHAWYSAFVPGEYHVQILSHAVKFIQTCESDSTFSMQLGNRVSLKGALSKNDLLLLASTMMSQYTTADANEEMHRVRFAPQRNDWWDKQWIRADPTHRLALLEYRRFGLVYPFGAANYHFNTPNRFLFEPNGRWIQSDHANPLESWDIEAVLEAGKRHGAPRGDLYGCLYFFLQEQLRAFAERLSRFKVSFHVFCTDARKLAQGFRDGSLADIAPPSLAFDRIEVSNIFDTEYVGIPRVLEDWTPLLKRSDDAAIVGSFMNWAPKQPGSSAKNSSERVISRLTKQMIEDGRMARPTKMTPWGLAEEMSSMMYSQLHNYTAYLDNSTVFKDYMRKNGMDDALKKHGLELRRIHKIVPHRLLVPLGADSSALPEFGDADAWYLHANLQSWTWSERFVEIVWKQ